MNQMWYVLLSVATLCHSIVPNYRENVYRQCSHLQQYAIAYFSPKCYTYTATYYNWYDARYECTKRGGMLWKMDKKELDRMVSQKMFVGDRVDGRLNVNTVWAGAQGKFKKWIDGSPIVLNHWDSIQKSYSNFKNFWGVRDMCMMVKDNDQPHINGNAYWEEESCSKLFTSICEHAPIEERTRSHIYKNLRRINGVLNPQLKAAPKRTEDSSELTECIRRCNNDTNCLLINFSLDNGCAIYYNIESAVANSAVSVVGWSVWAKES